MLSYKEWCHSLLSDTARACCTVGLWEFTKGKIHPETLQRSEADSSNWCTFVSSKHILQKDLSRCSYQIVKSIQTLYLKLRYSIFLYWLEIAAVMWKRFLIVTTWQRIVTQLRSSPRLYETFWRLSAQCFDFWAHNSAISQFTLTSLTLSKFLLKNALINPPYIICTASSGRHLQGHLGRNRWSHRSDPIFCFACM